MSIEWIASELAVKDLKEWDQNPRKITDEQFEKLKAGIQARGFHDVIKVDIDGTILSGHQRKRALTELGIERVNIVMPNRALTEDERKQIAIESNLHRGMFDFDLLGNSFDTNMLIDLGMTKFGLGLTDMPEDKKARRIVFSIEGDKYEETLTRIDNARNKLGCSDKTELLLELLSGVEQ